jgi:hypothetical protein
VIVDKVVVKHVTLLSPTKKRTLFSRLSLSEPTISSFSSSSSSSTSSSLQSHAS